jgi:hypothetical protein
MTSVETCFYCDQIIEDGKSCCMWSDYYLYTGLEDFSNALFKSSYKPKNKMNKTRKEDIEYDSDAFVDILIDGIRLD